MEAGGQTPARDPGSTSSWRINSAAVAGLPSIPVRIDSSSSSKVWLLWHAKCLFSFREWLCR